MTKEKRYFLSVVEEGVMNPKFEGFRAGRIELHDKKTKSGYAVAEYRFCIPEELIDWFRDKLDFYETDMPIRIEINMFDLPGENKKYYDG